MGQIVAAFSEYLNFNNIASMPSIHLLLFFEFNALPFWCKSNVCWKRHQNSEYGLVTLSCTLYEYLWTGKTYLLTQWIEITLRLFTILSLNYLINPQPLLLILKIRVNQGAGLDWFAKYFPSSDRMKSIKLTNEKQISIIYVPNMCKTLNSLLCRRKFVLGTVQVF